MESGLCLPVTNGILVVLELAEQLAVWHALLGPVLLPCFPGFCSKSPGVQGSYIEASCGHIAPGHLRHLSIALYTAGSRMSHKSQSPAPPHLVRQLEGNCTSGSCGGHIKSSAELGNQFSCEILDQQFFFNATTGKLHSNTEQVALVLCCALL